MEDEIETTGSILASEVRYQAGVLVGEQFGTYKKFARLSERMRKFLNLEVVGTSGKEKKWISAA